MPTINKDLSSLTRRNWMLHMGLCGTLEEVDRLGNKNLKSYACPSKTPQ